MVGVFEGFATIAAVIALGALLGHLGILDLSAQRLLSRLSFLVASPALMLVTLARTDVHAVFSVSIAATVVGVLAAAGLSVLVDRLARRRLGDTVIGALTASYVNAGNLGLPIATYVLGDATLVAPTLLLQLCVLQPFALALLDVDRARGGPRPSVWALLSRPIRNPLTVGSLIGVVLSLTGLHLPRAVHDPLALVGQMAVPSMLIAYGVSLRLGPRFGQDGGIGRVARAAALKLLVQPAAATVTALALGARGPALLAVAVMSALPTAQNIFVHASRYERSVAMARDTILVTTLGSVPLIVLLTLVLR